MIAVLAIIAALALSTILQPATALAGVFCMFGLEQWAMATDPSFFAAGEHRSLINLVIGFIVLLGLAQKIYRGHPILPRYPAVGLWVLTLFLYALVSTLWAPSPSRSLDLFLKAGPYIVTIVFLGPLLCSSTADFERMLTATFILGTLIIFLLMFTVEWKGRSVVIPGWNFFGSPLEAGALGGTTAIIAAFLSWPRFRFLSILKWIIVVLGLVTAIRSGSRGQSLGAVMAIFACWPIARRLHDFKAYATLGFVVALIAAATFWALDAYWPDSERWTADGALDEAERTRLRSSERVFDYWFTTPATIFFGLGSSASYNFIGFYLHVVPVEILIEEGIAGFLIYAGIVLSCIKNGLRSFFLVRYRPVQRPELATLCAIFIYHFVLSLKQGSFLGGSMLFMAAILLGKYHKALSHAHRRVQITGGDRSSTGTTDLR